MGTRLPSFVVSLAYLIGGFAFLFGAVLFGTGTGFVIRGQIDLEAAVFVGIGLAIFGSLYFSNRLISRTLRPTLIRIRNVSWMVGVALAIFVFVYYAIRVSTTG